MRWFAFLLSTLLFVVTGSAAAQRGEPPGLMQMQPERGQAFDPLASPARLSPRLQGNVGVDEFLHPDVAFVVSAEVADRNTVRVRWTIADGYYLYRDKFKFAVKDENGVTLEAVTLPSGKIKEDEFFGRVEVFYNNVESSLSLERSVKGLAELVLDVGYQGCAEAGLCYPPITKTVPLALPALPH